jgi:hypothetical protein
MGLTREEVLRRDLIRNYIPISDDVREILRMLRTEWKKVIKNRAKVEMEHREYRKKLYDSYSFIDHEDDLWTEEYIENNVLPYYAYLYSSWGITFREVNGERYINKDSVPMLLRTFGKKKAPEQTQTPVSSSSDKTMDQKQDGGVRA